MIPQELKDFIEQNCSGKEPSDIIMEAIGAKIEQLGAEGDEVLAYIDECAKGLTLEEKVAEAKRKAEAEAERLARIEEAKAKAESDAKKAELAAEKAKIAIAEAETARLKSDAIKAQQQIEHEKKQSKKHTKKLIIISTIILAIIGIVSFSFYYYIHTGKSAADLAAEAVYNSVQNQGNIDDIEIDTSNLPNDDPNVVIDPNGDVKTQLQKYYSNVQDLRGGFYVVKNDGLYGIIDAKGKVIQKPKYSYIGSKDKRGMMRVEQDKKIGFLNINGVQIVTPQYDKVENECNGLIKVMKNSLFGFIDAKTMMEVTPCQFEYIYNFENNKYKAILDGNTVYLSSDGSIVEL